VKDEASPLHLIRCPDFNFPTLTYVHTHTHMHTHTHTYTHTYLQSLHQPKPQNAVIGST